MELAEGTGFYFFWAGLELLKIVVSYLFGVKVDVEIFEFVVYLLIIESLLAQDMIFLRVLGLIYRNQHFGLFLTIDFYWDLANLLLKLLASYYLLQFDFFQLFTSLEI